MKRIYSILIFCFFISSAFAQKLPDVQASNVVAPSNIKIDGKATEWNDTFAAENKRTDIYYTLANDDKNLYLVLKSVSTASASKIIAGGITFNINTQGKKREKDAFSITYPLIKRVPGAGRGGQGQNQGGQNRQAGGQGGFQNRAQQTQQQRDSAALVQRKNQLATVKEIKIAGFKNIKDTLISIYNEYGIKTVGLFDAKGEFVYELAIPLSLLELSINDTKEFVYQIKVNGLSTAGFGGGNGGRTFAGNAGGNGGGNFGAPRGNVGAGFNGGGSGMDMMSPTDFWGKYSFTKK